MSGLEIVALIPAIVSAFGVISVEYREWRKRRLDRRTKSKNVALQKLLEGNGGTVQGEYDEDLRRLGPVFRQGDGIGREALMYHLITLQSTVISLLRDRHNDMSFLVHPNHNSLSESTQSTRDEIISALIDQYQRLAQAQPITQRQRQRQRQRQLPAPATARPSRPVFAENCFNHLTCTTVSTVFARYSCTECGWDEKYHAESVQFETSDGHLLDPASALTLFHHYERGSPNGFRCFLCAETMSRPRARKDGWGDGAYALLKELETHVKGNHSLEELRQLEELE